MNNAISRVAFATENTLCFTSFKLQTLKMHAVIQMSSDDKMEPFLASEMAWVCHVNLYISTKTKICNN